MKKFISLLLCFIISFSLTACGVKSTQGTGNDNTEKTSSFPSDGRGAFFKKIDFKAQYIRTDKKTYCEDEDTALWITSVAELNEYYEQNKDKYYLESVADTASDKIGFADAVKKYDEAFFEKYDLIIVVLEETSGSYRHEVTSVGLYYSVLDRVQYFIQPAVKRIKPDFSTDDMANWHIIIEVEKEYGMNSSQLLFPEITAKKK